MLVKVIDPAPIIKQLADRCLVAKGLECSILGELIDLLRAAPTVDAAEVVHGRNLDAEWPSLFECSICHWSCSDTVPGDTENYNYCPNCGAKMDGERKDNGTV